MRLVCIIDVCNVCTSIYHKLRHIGFEYLFFCHIIVLFMIGLNVLRVFDVVAFDFNVFISFSQRSNIELTLWTRLDGRREA